MQKAKGLRTRNSSREKLGKYAEKCRTGGLYGEAGRMKLMEKCKVLEEFDVDKYEGLIKAEGIEIGIKKGIQQGTEYGRQLERERLNKLIGILLEQKRMEDLKRSIAEPEYQEKLFREFHL